MADATPLDTTTEVVTPENIAFEYQLAGPFRRLPAYALDVALYTGVLVLLVFFGLLVFSATLSGTLVSMWVFVALIIWFVFGWFYGALCETYFNGRTIGKWACGLRVISVDGRPLSGMQATIRNLLRVSDIAPYAALPQAESEIAPVLMIPTAIIGLLAVIFTRRMQRLGDLAAGTMVVVDEKSWRLPVARVDDARVPALAAYIPGDYRVTQSMARTLAAYAERRAYLTPPRRREVARHLTTPLIDRFEFRPDIDPDLLMYALYYQTFLAADNQEPGEIGALAGFSPLRKDMARASLVAAPPAEMQPRGTARAAAVVPSMEPTDRAVASADQPPAPETPDQGETL